MIAGKHVLAVIPARAGSKGLPGKNRRLLSGKPLFAWPLETALKAKAVDRVVVSSDDPEILRIAATFGQEIALERPSELAADTATTFAVLEHAVKTLADQGQRYDYLTLLEPTSPLTEPGDVDQALAFLHSRRSVADSIVGIARSESQHPDFVASLDGNGLIRPHALPDFTALGRRQDLKPLYYFEGSLYISAIDVLLQNKSFYHDRTLGYVMPKWKAFEVDDQVDWYCVEAMLAHRAEFRS